MRIERVKVRNLGCLSDVDLDLTSLPPSARIVGVVGPNGSGKTTLLSLATGGALYRDTGSRGSLVELSEWAGARDSLLEVGLRHEGRPYCLKHLVDGVAKNSSAVATNGDGSVVPSTRDGKVSTFDAWAAETFPQPEVLYSSFVAQQRGDGLLDPSLTRGDRKAILLRALGVEKLEQLSEAARKRAQVAGDEAKVVEAKLQVERERAGDVLQAAADLEADQAELAAAQKEADILTAQVQMARERVERAKQQVATWRVKSDEAERLSREYDAALQRQEELTRRLEAANRATTESNAAVASLVEQVPGLAIEVDRCRQWVATTREQANTHRGKARQAKDLRARVQAISTRLLDLGDRVKNNEAVLGEADAIRMAGLDREKALARIQELEQRRAQLSAQLTCIRERAGAAQTLAAQAELACLSLGKRAKELEDRLESEQAVLRSVEELPVARADVERLARELQAAESELERLRGKRVAGADERISLLRRGHDAILALGASTDEALELSFRDAVDVSEACLASDDNSVAMANELPQAVTRQAAAVGRAKTSLTEAQGVEWKLSQSAALAPNMAAAKADLEEVRLGILEAKNRFADQKQVESALHSESTALQAEFDSTQYDKLQEKLTAERLSALADKAIPLANAETRLSELRPQVEAARTEWNSVRAELDELEVWLADNRFPDEQEAELCLMASEQYLSQDNEKLAAARASLAAAHAAACELEPELRTQRLAVVGLGGSLLVAREWLDQNPRPALDAFGGELQVAECELQRNRDRVTSASAELAVAQSRHATAVEAAGRIDELESVSSELRQHQSDWTLLGRCLGRDGLQAALIDAAGPQLTEIANDLLHRCVGPRFSVSFETTRLDAKGKRVLEDFDVRVFDADVGKWKLAKRLSGGELALVSLAVSLALTQLACQRQGTRGATLVRDESGAALDSEKAPQYVAMLRLAAEAIGADRVLLVSHVPAVVELCDARLEMSNGEARLAT